MSIQMVAPELPFDPNTPPKDIFLEDFKIDLPITGQWGYSEEFAVIIDDDVSKDQYFSSFPVVVEKRIYEELIVFREGWDRFSMINWDLVSQQLIETDTGHYDFLIYNVTALRDSAFEFLRQEFESSNGFVDDPEGLENHKSKRDSLTVSYKAHYWFKLPMSVINA